MSQSKKINPKELKYLLESGRASLFFCIIIFIGIEYVRIALPPTPAATQASKNPRKTKVFMAVVVTLLPSLLKSTGTSEFSGSSLTLLYHLPGEVQTATGYNRLTHYE